jgi:HK97 family phage portal protein
VDENTPAIFRMSASCTPAAPSADFVQALMGFPAAAGKIVTRATAIRVASFLSAVKMLANDIAKMPLVLRETTIKDRRQRTIPALDNPLYPVLKYCPNPWQTSYQMRWFQASQLIMQGNSFCQKIVDQKGDTIALNPLNAWDMCQRWDLSDPKKPVLFWEYENGRNHRRFEQNEIWHTTNINFEGNGIEGASIIALAKESLSVLMAAEETAGRQFANGLGMGGFITAPAELEIDEPQAQNIVDRLKRDFAGSQNAGKFTFLPGNLSWQKMSFNAQESQLLESRKWNAEEVVRLLGGAPLLVKLGMGAQNSTYASSSAFLDEYFNTSLLPYCVSIEQTITRDLIDPKDRAKLYAKHDANVILRGSLRERAETYEIQLRSGQVSPNEVAVLEDRDTVDGFGDVRFFPANSGYFDPKTGEYAIPGQATPTPNPSEVSQPAKDQNTDPSDDDAADGSAALKNRLLTIVNGLAERIERKAATAGELKPSFVADVMSTSTEQAEKFCATSFKTKEDMRAALIALALEN